MKKSILFLFIFCSINMFAQFGQNKVQYKEFTWYYIQTNHFDIYFSQQGGKLAEFSAKVAEEALSSISANFNYKINNRITLIVYNSTNDFQETNVTEEYLSEGIEGFTELFKNRVVVQFQGSYKQFRHLIHHELVHAVMNDMFYGGSIQNIISNNININVPLWFSEGMAEYQALGWDVNTDMFIRDAALNEYMPDIQQFNGYWAYRGGQAVFYYISKKYGPQKVTELINKVKGVGGLEEGLKETIGLTVEELNENFKKDIKKRFWPDIAYRVDPDDFAKRLTDHRKDGGFYNTSPALSPQGDKIAFITNRNFFFDVYLMNANDGKIIKRLVQGNRSSDFEELNILTPGLTWSPDGKKIALSAKSDGWDVLYVIDVESEDRDILPVRFESIKSVSWSNDGKTLAFIGHTPEQSDVYTFNLSTKQIQNITSDIFTENYPTWSPDDKLIYFSSDRLDNLYAVQLPDSFRIYNYDYSQSDIYSIELATKTIKRITDLPISDETSPVLSPDGKEMLFISDNNGINNIWKIKLNGDTTAQEVPVTNSQNGIYQLTTSKDGKKLAFSTMYQSAYNIYLITNPFELKLDTPKLSPTLYMSELLKGRSDDKLKLLKDVAEPDTNRSDSPYFTGEISEDTVYGDSLKIDYGNYVFGNIDTKKDTAKENAKVAVSDNLDSQGNYKVHRYKTNFSTDIVYANAGFNTLYGLQGTTILSFSDVLGNHRIVGVTSLQIDLKNSDYGVAYYYLPKRIDYGIQLFHTARFVGLSTPFGVNLYRYRNYGAVGSATYPLSRFYRFEGGLSLLNVSQENLDNTNEEMQKATFLIPSLSFVHDNVLWGYTSPIEGTRYRFDFYGNPLKTKELGFYTLQGDYRHYFRFWYDYSFVVRFSGGMSNGNNAQRFFIGGVENWINRHFATGDIPLETVSDFAFLTSALPLRGYDYAQRIGTRYSLMNLELRFPFIRYLVTGGLPFLFSNILGTAFVDAGTAWSKDKNLRFFQKTKDGGLQSKDLLVGTGVGLRAFVLYFLLRFDVAWAYDFQGFTKPKYYISLGADF